MKTQYSDWTLLKRMAIEARAYWPHVLGISRSACFPRPSRYSHRCR